MKSLEKSYIAGSVVLLLLLLFGCFHMWTTRGCLLNAQSKMGNALGEETVALLGNSPRASIAATGNSASHWMKCCYVINRDYIESIEMSLVAICVFVGYLLFSICNIFLVRRGHT